MKIYIAARDGDLHTIKNLASNGVDVTGIVSDVVSMCIAIQYIVLFDDIVYIEEITTLLGQILCA